VALGGHRSGSGAMVKATLRTLPEVPSIRINHDAFN
jgi:hypothetical protein